MSARAGTMQRTARESAQELVRELLRVGGVQREGERACRFRGVVEVTAESGTKWDRKRGCTGANDLLGHASIRMSGEGRGERGEERGERGE